MVLNKTNDQVCIEKGLCGRHKVDFCTENAPEVDPNIKKTGTAKIPLIWNVVQKRPRRSNLLSLRKTTDVESSIPCRFWYKTSSQVDPTNRLERPMKLILE